MSGLEQILLLEISAFVCAHLNKNWCYFGANEMPPNDEVT